MSPTSISKKTIGQARLLRHNLTDGERRLWSELREFRRLYGVHVRKQAPVGVYIADFVIHAAKLVIEIDGEWHFTAEGRARDAKRDLWLKEQGYRTIRLTTTDLEQAFDGCIEEILHALGLMDDREPTSHPASVPQPLGSFHEGSENSRGARIEREQ